MSEESEGYAEKLLKKLELPANAFHEDIKKAFLNRKTELVNSKEAKISLEDASTDLKEICEFFCRYNSERIESVNKRNRKDETEHEDAGSMRSRTLAVRKGVYKVAAEFSLCELEINRTSSILEADIKTASAHAHEDHKKVEGAYELTERVADAF